MSNLILVTGGCGYIGSHTVVALIAAGYEPMVLDNLSNSNVEVLSRIENITGVRVGFIEGDVRDAALLKRVFSDAQKKGTPIKAVVHFAAKKAVGESVKEPLSYYENNVAGTLELLKAMRAANVKSFVFSSSATVYDANLKPPFHEDHPLGPINPYGWTKMMVERILEDECKADDNYSAVVLRYFNPIGAHPSGMIGEDPMGVPNNLFPYLMQVGVGRRPLLSVFGNTYPTHDGTGVRDYIHVVDLAEGHTKAVDLACSSKGFIPINLGTGRGTSVLELVSSFERITGRTIPLRIDAPRPGDLAESWAYIEKASQILGWTAKYDIDRMCEDGWRWQSHNPDGYTS